MDVLERVTPNRRCVVAGSAALAMQAGLASRSRAAAPFVRSQAPSWYRFTLGQFECTVVSDGSIDLGPPEKAFLGLEQAVVGEMLERNFLPLDRSVIEQNALVINTGQRLVLIDAGMGSLKSLGPASGRLVASLRQAGIDPAAIDAIAISHAHFDHIGAIMSDDGRRNFPNAQYYVMREEFDFWTDERKLGSPVNIIVEVARKHLLPNRDRLVFIRDGQEFLPGIQALAAPGHTPGHTTFVITSAGRSLVYIADVSHHQVLLLERPRAKFVFDTDADQAVTSRIRVLDMLAAQRLPILAYHFPWPGIGHVTKQGDGFRYIAAPASTSATAASV
jgi:glyoxylase-like metal-dependent hydrolase (beta-lactamase superfamily II)